MHSSNSNYSNSREESQDSLRRRQMEAERAAECLEWFQEFEQEIQSQAWEELKKGKDSNYRAMALCIEEFKNLLIRKVNDGRFAKEEMKEDGQ